jgi:hypothetical protein
MATLDVVDVAPPTPFTCREFACAEPIAESRIESQSFEEAGRSLSWKNRPFEVPALIHTAGILFLFWKSIGAGTCSKLVIVMILLRCRAVCMNQLVKALENVSFGAKKTQRMYFIFIVI